MGSARSLYPYVSHYVQASYISVPETSVSSVEVISVPGVRGKYILRIPDTLVSYVQHPYYTVPETSAGFVRKKMTCIRHFCE